MGIPRFFKKIISDYPDTTISIKDVKNVDYFFIDFNALIYSVYEELKKTTKLHKVQEFEKKLINAVCNYVKEMVHTINPQKQLYLAMDGPVPRAKMVQQRWRRFKSVPEAKYIEHLKKKNNLPIEKEWDKTNISPGTEFMVNLAGQLYKFMKKKEFGNCEVILSDTLVPGEGEHKFMPLVRDLAKTDDNIVIFSPDADLIVLSIVSNKNNIFILRVPNKKQDPELYNRYSDKGLLYLSIDICKKYFIADLSNEYHEKIDIYKMTLDFTFLTFLCGNDFVLPMQYLRISKNMRDDGFTKIKKIYKNLLNKNNENIVIDGSKSKQLNYTINLKIFKKILNDIAKNETHYFQLIKKNNDILRKNPDKCKKRGYEELSDYEKELNNYEHSEYVCSINPFHKKYNPLFYKINPYKKIWMDEYYKFYFGLNNKDKEYVKKINEICHNYLESIVFNLKYYASSSPPSWKWFYKYNVPPTMTDFSRYVQSLKSLSSIKFTKGKPFTPFEQLMLILPHKSIIAILPKCLSNKNKNNSINFDLNAVYGQKYIYSDPILPPIDADKIVEIVKNNSSKFTIAEKKRNIIGKIKKVKYKYI